MNTNTIPSAATIAVLATDDRITIILDLKAKRQGDAAMRMLTADPALAFVLVEYTYCYDYGSDGCWTSNETSTCTLGQWIHGISIPGNRAYNFSFKRNICADPAACAARRTEYRARMEEAAKKVREAEAKRAAEFAAKEAANKAALEAARIKFLNRSVTSKKGDGIMMRVMKSHYSDTIIAQVAGKWINVKSLKLA